MTQYAILTDLNKCVGCLACSVACKVANDVNVGMYWNKILRVGPTPRTEGGQWPDVYMYFLPMSCQHCANPACVDVCPTGASYKAEDGTIQIDAENCIGCMSCMSACPYGVRYLNEETNIVEKCTLCKDKIDNGELPQCVAQCGGRARWFGDVEQGWESFVGPGCDVNDPSYDAQAAFRNVLGETTGETGEFATKPYAAEEIYQLPNDAGTNPSFGFILRGEKWQSAEGAVPSVGFPVAE